MQMNKSYFIIVLFDEIKTQTQLKLHIKFASSRDFFWLADPVHRLITSYQPLNLRYKVIVNRTNIYSINNWIFMYIVLKYY